ncbi:hypothetical protein D3C84_637230 [compost metagenome]
MIEPHPIEGVLQCNHALNLMGHDHCIQHRPHGQRHLAIGNAFLRQVIGDGENRPQIVRGMAPLSGQPGVVVVEPAHDAADVPGGLDRIQAVTRTGNTRATGHDGALDDRPQVFGAFGKAQGQQAAAQGVHQTIASRVQSLLGLDLEAQYVVGNVLQDLVVVGAVVQVNVGAHVRFTRQVVR